MNEPAPRPMSEIYRDKRHYSALPMSATNIWLLCVQKGNLCRRGHMVRFHIQGELPSYNDQFRAATARVLVNIEGLGGEWAIIEAETPDDAEKQRQERLYPKRTTIAPVTSEAESVSEALKDSVGLLPAVERSEAAQGGVAPHVDDAEDSFWQECAVEAEKQKPTHRKLTEEEVDADIPF
jgi:hypothetical protein